MQLFPSHECSSDTLTSLATNALTWMTYAIPVGSKVEASSSIIPTIDGASYRGLSIFVTVQWLHYITTITFLTVLEQDG
jgi:hypothetical protein